MYYQIAPEVLRKSDSTVRFVTIFSYFKAFRDACVMYFNADPVNLGGPGETFEVDETVLACRKVNRDKLVLHQ